MLTEPGTCTKVELTKYLFCDSLVAVWRVAPYRGQTPKKV